jgi:hypothetical protein
MITITEEIAQYEKRGGNTTILAGSVRTLTNKNKIKPNL